MTACKPDHDDCIGFQVVRNWEEGILKKRHSLLGGFHDFGHHLMLNFYSSLENEIQGPVKFKNKLQKLKDLNREDRESGSQLRFDLTPLLWYLVLHKGYKVQTGQDTHYVST